MIPDWNSEMPTKNEKKKTLFSGINRVNFNFKIEVIFR